jgi:ATP-dependent helicase HepA
VVEQRIGRLDRIGRTRPVQIVYFRPPRGIGRDVVRLFEELGVFREPMAGLEPQLAHVESTIEALALDPDARLTDEQLQATVAEAQAARSRIHEAAYQQLHREPYRPDMAAPMLARLPADLDALNEQVVTTACARLGLMVERTRGHAVYSIELGHDALVESLPDVPGGSTFVGSFDREEAVDDETIDFFASGHPLVEGVFAHWDDSPLGRVALLEVTIDGEPGEGLVAVYKDGWEPRILALDRSGPRPDWSAAFNRRPLRARALPGPPGNRDRWTQMIRALGEQLDPALQPQLIAAVVFRSRAIWAGASAGRLDDAGFPSDRSRT